MEKKIETKIVATYAGHSVKQNKAVDLALKCKYDELVNYIQLIQFLNVDVTVVAKVPDQKPIKLGLFRVKEVKVDGDGEGMLKFNGLADYVEIDAINKLIGSELINIRFTAEVEIEEEENCDEDGEWEE